METTEPGDDTAMMKTREWNLRRPAVWKGTTPEDTPSHREKEYKKRKGGKNKAKSSD